MGGLTLAGFSLTRLPMAKTKVKNTASKGTLTAALGSSAVLSVVVPVVATVATGGIAAVTMPMWVALGGVVSGLLAGNVELEPADDAPVVNDQEPQKADSGDA